MTVSILCGDARKVLQTLERDSVQCCVTSPPYFGLRSYLPDGHADKPKEIGLEPSPDAYIAQLVAVFREVRRVLRDDGTLWLNLGASYARDIRKGQHKPGDAGKQNYIIERGGGRTTGGLRFDGGSGGKRPTPSPLPQRARSCGNDGTEPQCSQGPDCACLGQCDGPQDGFRCHRDRTDGKLRPIEPVEQPPSPTGHGSAHSGSSEASSTVSPRGAPASTSQSWQRNAEGVDGPGASVSEYQKGRQTSPGGEPPFARREGGTDDTPAPEATSTQNTPGKQTSGLACSCGSCGICWVNIAVPMLKFKPKDLIDIPTLVALALQADGWWLRSDIIWHKPNPMPESVTDRPTSAHEHVFLLTKSARYFYNAEAVKEEAVADHPSGNGFKRDARQSFVNSDGTARGSDKQWDGVGGTRNLRNVWTIATQPFAGAHFATMPPDLVERCIKAGSRPGDMILDPFGGAGTTGLVADRLNRHATLIELNTNYAQMAKNRITQDNPLFITTT